mmetsp:Transcript_23693/g.56097  ORF Transcript_23693/g.56097 Transcript_23693/m.56097 type:complete len:654 (+) Transcript_23693:234-2195(+)
MTCTRLLIAAGRSKRCCFTNMLSGASAARKGTTKRGIVTRSLPSTASSSSSTKVMMSPLILHQNQSPHPNLLFVDEPRHHTHYQYHQEQPCSSVVANVVEYSTYQNLKPSSRRICRGGGVGGRSPGEVSKSSTELSSQMATLRQAHTHAAAHRLVAKKRKPTASGWKKPIVSSSSGVRSLSEPTNPNDASASTTTKYVESETTSPDFESMSVNTVGVDMEELLKLASKKTTPLSLKDMYKYAIVDSSNREQRIRNAQFLHSELPVRVAQRAVDLLTLPHGLNEIPAILQVAHVYLLYLEKFQDCPVPTDAESEDVFTDMLQNMILERSSIPNAIAQGVDTWMKTQNEKDAANEVADSDTIEMERTQSLKIMEDALYRFFTARVGLRFLTEHHILSSPTRATNEQEDSELDGDSSEATENDDKESFLGCIEPNCCPTREVRKVVEAVRRQTMEYYGDGMCPEIQIVDGDIAAQQQEHQKKKKGTNNFTYVPHHLHYMVGELLKNSCRATVKRYIESGATDEKIPPIRIVIVKGAEDVTIKIADRGGGIKRSQMSEIWKFAHSTAAKDEIENETDFGVDEITGAPIRGFGLPLARVYARYLGGEMTLKSLEGHGLDAYLHLPRLGNNCENLPLPVQFSPSNLNSNPLRSSTTEDE